MLSCSIRVIFETEKLIVKIGQAVFDGDISAVHKKKVFQRFMMEIEGFQKTDKIQQISFIECPVFVALHPFQVPLLMMEDKIVWCHVHPVQQVIAFSDDGDALTPGKDSGKQRGNLYVLIFSKPVRDRHRVVNDKTWPVILLHFMVQEIFEVRKVIGAC